MMNKFLGFLASVLGYYCFLLMHTGCAQISAPTGGPKDTLAPVLVKASPLQESTSFSGRKITLNFNEYIDVQDLQSNLMISPYQKSSPNVSFNLKTISIKFKDSLLPNTTYSIDFGNAIRDVHEGNILKNFTYVFSTGPVIDSLKIEGRLLMSETGKPDSTLAIMLYRNTDDSAVLKQKPDYITYPDGAGNFVFHYLPDAPFRVYALKDGDGGKTYNSPSELFAFSEEMVNSSLQGKPVTLFAYAEEKQRNNNVAESQKPAGKKLQYSSNLMASTQDLLRNLELDFNNPLKDFDAAKIILSDSSFTAIRNYTCTLDSSRKKISITNLWLPETAYILTLPTGAVSDSAGNRLPTNDTLQFISKKNEDYGSLLLRFSNLDLSRHPVLQFVESGTVKHTVVLSGSEWSRPLFQPGEYELRLFYDENNNGLLDPGSFSKRLQPEKAISFPQKLSVKANWENERDIKL